MPIEQVHPRGKVVAEEFAREANRMHFPRRYRVRILPYHNPRQRLPGLRLGEVLRVMQKRAAVGDALIAAQVNHLYAGLEAFVTWNDGHFRARLAAPVFTPATFSAV